MCSEIIIIVKLYKEVYNLLVWDNKMIITNNKGNDEEIVAILIRVVGCLYLKYGY